VRGPLAAAAALLAAACTQNAQVPAGDLFTEVAAASGLHFVYFNGMSGEYYYAEMMGGGVALLDFDNDGDLDVYLTQGGMLGPGKTLADAILPVPEGPLTDRLFRNDLSVNPDGSRSLRFTDVTEAAGVHAAGYGMGAAAADYDNDGWTDLYVLNYGPNQLLHNNGDGTFSDVTAKAGAGDSRWSVSASFADIDADGWLDLFVANYVDFNFANHRQCFTQTSAPSYCGPSVYAPQPDRLLRNLGNGRFDDVTVTAGLSQEYGSGLGVVAADFNGDGHVDIYVANDGKPNQLWINLGDGRFRNDAVIAGAAVNMDGVAEAGMGVDAADIDGDGDLDLILTHLARETNTVYVNDGKGWFEDRSIVTGLGAPSVADTGFGTAWFDYDNDGLLDLLAVNGAVDVIENQLRAGEAYPLRQKNKLYRNAGGASLRFEDVSAQGGAALALSEVSRGAAFGDIDNDGDTDVVIVNNGGPARLLRNEVGNRNAWLGLRLVDAHGRDALGARVRVETADGRVLWRWARSDGSYASANDPRVLVGLGDARGVRSVTVRWPTGEGERWRDVASGRYTVLRQGTGEALP